MRGVIVLAVSLVLTSCAERPSVEVNGDTLVGAREGGIFAFLGVPYAEPPLGDLRWRAPQPLESRSPQRDATRFAAACMQTTRTLDWYRDVAETFGGSRDYHADLDIGEDCLYLNVWTPTLDANAGLPVMVWIHGGSNISGWSYEPNTHGHRLADEGVVVVSIGYRVGLFGFMSHPDLDPAGPVANFALWDIISALRWVRDNIDLFGGDPGRVTLFGESSGAHNIVMLMAAEPARGLFQRAIAQSAAGFGIHMSSLGEMQARGEALASAMGYVGNDTLRRLRRAPADQLLERYVAEVSAGFQLPTLDGQLFNQRPWDTFAAGEFGDVSLIIGTNADEWWDYVDPDAGTDDVIRATGELLNLDASVTLDAVADESDPRRAIARIKTADDYLCPSQGLAAAISVAGRDAWAYYFTRIREDEGGRVMRAYHGAEFPYIFDTHDPFMRTSDTDATLTRIMQRYWTAFAATGDPNAAASPAWPSFEAPDFAVLELGDDVATIRAPEPLLCAGFDARR